MPRWHVQRGDGGGAGAEVRGLRCGVVRGTGSWSGAVGAESAEGCVRCEPGTYDVAVRGELECQLRGVLAGAVPGRRGRCGMQGVLAGVVLRRGDGGAGAVSCAALLYGRRVVRYGGGGWSTIAGGQR